MTNRDWNDSMPETASTDPLMASALEVLDANRRRGRSHIPAASYDYTCPSTHSYPFQFNWDSCFHAIALTHVDVPRAQAELSSLLCAQQASGFIPHMVLWPEALRSKSADDFTIVLAENGWHTVTTNPPVLPLAAERVWSAGHDTAWLDTVLPGLVAMMRWWRKHRDAAGTGLVSIFQPDESGLDSSPKYDALLGIQPSKGPETAERWHESMRELFTRYRGTDGTRDPDADLVGRGSFAWQDVLVNAIYGNSAAALARLLRARNRSDEATQWSQAAAATTRALLAHNWDPSTGAFYDTYRDLTAPTGYRQEKVLTATSLFPLILADLPTEASRRLVQHLTNEAEFWLPYPVPSVAATEPSFDPDFSTKALFRGTTWTNLNWYIHLGLRLHGYAEVADELARRTRAMVASSGLRECYNPHDATGYAAHGFGWSSLVLDLPTADSSAGPRAYVASGATSSRSGE